jgi:hypothetical protein
VCALAQWFDASDDAEVNALVYEVEKLHHGTPSGTTIRHCLSAAASFAGKPFKLST